MRAHPAPDRQTELKQQQLLARVETLFRESAVRLEKLYVKTDVRPAPGAGGQTSGAALRAQNQSVTVERHMLEELVMAAYYNRNNPDWDPARAETYWTELAVDDPLRLLLGQLSTEPPSE
jgi:hypothetical protein